MIKSLGFAFEERLGSESWFRLEILVGLAEVADQLIFQPDISQSSRLPPEQLLVWLNVQSPSTFDTFCLEPWLRLN